MRLFEISYALKEYPGERHKAANRYVMPEAREMTEYLKTCGATDFQFHPVVENK